MAEKDRFFSIANSNSNIGKNCSDFFTKRPPLVIFLLCLILLAFSLISLTFHIKYTDKLLDTDSKQNWLTLAKYVSDNYLCPKSEDIRNTEETSELVSFTTLIDCNLTNLDLDTISETKVEVTYNISTWNSICMEKLSNNLTIKIEFITSTNSNKNGTRCALLTGPKAFLPQFSESVCHFVPKDNVVRRQFTNIPRRDAHKCTNGISLKLDGNQNVDNFSVYLDDINRNIIYTNLVWCSYILLLVLLIVTFIIMFKR